MLFNEGAGFEEEAVEFVMIYIDPVLLAYYLIAVGIFIFATYKKPELRIFNISFGCIIMAIIMMMVHNHEGEAIFIFLSGITSVLSILFYRAKVGTKTTEVGING